MSFLQSLWTKNVVTFGAKFQLGEAHEQLNRLIMKQTESDNWWEENLSVYAIFLQSSSKFMFRVKKADGKIIMPVTDHLKFVWNVWVNQ